MLRYNENNLVEFIYPGETLHASVELINEYKDNTELLQKVLVYVFNVYSPNSIYSEFTPEQRKERVCLDLFDNKIKKEYFESKTIKSFVDLFVEMSMTAVQRDHERCKRDIEDLHEYISSIQFVKKQKIKRKIVFKDEELGREFEKEIDLVIDIDNSEEKIKAISVREKLYSIDQRLRKLVEAEKIEKELSAKTMFEQ